MKRIHILLLINLMLFNIACEKVIELNLDNSQERLVIEGLLQWEKGTSGAEQIIKLSKTGSFYANKIVPATGATITITRQNGSVFIFAEMAEGVYATTNFEPEIDAVYMLEIRYNEEIYTATNTMKSVVEIDSITQSTEEGFYTNEPEINIFFTDPIGEGNHYSVSYERISGDSMDSYSEQYDDSFEDGNVLNLLYELPEINVGDQFEIRLSGISKEFSDYIILIENQEDADIGPFTISPVNVKGNCINQSNLNNYPYGYFSLSEVVAETYNYQ